MSEKQMTIEEAKAMVGTEFTYIFEDGDTIQGYVKKFDPEIGLTCLSLDVKTRDGYSFLPSVQEPGGTVCIIAMDFSNEREFNQLDEALSRLAEIKETGVYIFRGNAGGFGTPVCAFM